MLDLRSDGLDIGSLVCESIVEVLAKGVQDPLPVLVEIPRHGILEEQENVRVQIGYKHLHVFGVIQMSEPGTVANCVCDLAKTPGKACGDPFVVGAGSDHGFEHAGEQRDVLASGRQDFEHCLVGIEAIA